MNNPLTVKEFKSILNHYDMNERDRDRLMLWHNQAYETIEKTSSIDTIDFTPFLMDGVIHEGGHNTVDFENLSNFKTINSLLAEELPASFETIKQLIRNNIKKILTAQLNKTGVVGDFNDIFNINETFIANLVYYGSRSSGYICYLLGNNNYNFNKVFKSFASLDIMNNNRNRLQMITGIDINALFYISNDVAIAGTPVSRALGASPINIPNHFIHAHICLGNDQLFADMMKGVNVLADEYIDNLPFISYVEVSEIKKKPLIIDISNVLPYTLSAEQITAINEHNVEIIKGLWYYKPIGYLMEGDIHNADGLITFFNDEGKLEGITIEANQITSINTAQTT